MATIDIRVGDCRDLLRAMPEDSVHCVVTSPPYWGLRDYGVNGQIGLEPTPQEFVAKMVDVFREVRRVLRKDGTLFLNMGDSYFGGGGGGGSKGSKQQTNAGFLIPGHTRRDGVQRAASCDTDDKGLAGFRASDCLCGSLCGACRVAYRIGKSHNGGRLDPTPDSSSFLSTQARKGSPSDHAPTSDSSRLIGRSEASIDGLSPSVAREPLPPLVSQEMTTKRESSQPHPANFLPSVRPSECLLCGCSLPDSYPAFSRMEACICDTTDDASVGRKIGKDASDSAYPHFATVSLKPKDLVGMPWRLAFALQADGWWLRQDIIWAKPNPMPESIRDRCTKAHEYLFLLTKSERYHFDADAIAEPAGYDPARTKMPDGWDTGAGGHGTFHRQGREKGRRTMPGVAGWASNESSDHSAVANARGDRSSSHYMSTKKVGPNSRENVDRVPRGRKAGNKTHKGVAAYEESDSEQHRTKAGLLEIAETAYPTRNKRSVWTVASEPFAEAHFATFPTGLIVDCVKAGCPAGGVVLDPFGGAGTTGVVAQRLSRDAVLLELNPEYADLARRRIDADAMSREAGRRHMARGKPVDHGPLFGAPEAAE